MTVYKVTKIVEYASLGELIVAEVYDEEGIRDDARNISKITVEVVG